MKVILTQFVKNLGRQDEVVNVKKGYAFNFLFPRGMAEVATAGRVAQAQARFDKRVIAKERIKEQATSIKGKLEGLTLTIPAKTNEDNVNLYGSVTEKDIIEEIETQISVRLEKKHVMLAEPIRKVGEFKVGIKLDEGVETDVAVKVVSQ